MSEESSQEQQTEHKEFSILLNQLRDELKDISKLENLKELSKLSELEKLEQLEKLEKHAHHFELLNKIDEIGKLTSLERLDELKELSHLNKLDKLSELNALRWLEDLKQVELFTETLKEEGHRLDQLKRINELEKLNRLSELEKLESLQKLDQLNKLDFLKELEKLDSLTILSKVDDFNKTLEKHGERLDLLKKVDELDALNKLDKLVHLDTLKELSRLETLEQLSWLASLEQLKKVDEFNDVFTREGHRLDNLQKLERLSELGNLEKLNLLQKLDNLHALENLNKLDGLDKLSSAETQKTLDKLLKLDKLDELKHILDNKFLFVLKGLISVVVNIAGIALVSGALFYGIFLLEKKDKITKLIPFMSVDEKVVSSFALKSLEGLLDRGQFQEVILNVQEKLNKQVDRYWDLSLKFSLPERYNMLESIRSMTFSSENFPLKERVEEKMSFERNKFKETLDRDFERLKIQHTLTEEEIQTLLSIKILTYNGQCEKAASLIKDFDFSRILEHSFVQKMYLMNLDCLENQQVDKSKVIWSILQK